MRERLRRLRQRVTGRVAAAARATVAAAARREDPLQLTAGLGLVTAGVWETIHLGAALIVAGLALIVLTIWPRRG